MWHQRQLQKLPLIATLPTKGLSHDNPWRRLTFALHAMVGMQLGSQGAGTCFNFHSGRGGGSPLYPLPPPPLPPQLKCT